MRADGYLALAWAFMIPDIAFGVSRMIEYTFAL